MPDKRSTSYIWPPFIILVLLPLVPTSLGESLEEFGASRAERSRGEFYRRLALFHAPINFQDTEIRGESQDERNPASVDQPLQRRGDYMTRFDFDGDWNGLNNWSNFAKRPPDDSRRDSMAEAYMYYSVVETATHYFINYCTFHPHDREPRCSDSECHENDLEGGLHMVRKGPENGGLGTLWLMMYLAHDYWFTHLTPAGREVGIQRGGKAPHETPKKAQHYNADFIYDVVWRGMTPSGEIFTPRGPHLPTDSTAPEGTSFHPTTWQEPWGHGMYGWPGPDARSPYDRYRSPEYPWKNGFINGDGVIYLPGMEPGIPDYRKEVEIARYALIDIFEPGGLWERRDQIDWEMNGCGGGPRGSANCTWGYFGALRGERWGIDKANAPWRWDHDDDHLPPGAQAFGPLSLVEEFNNLGAVRADELSHTYVNNKYLGIPAGQRPHRAPPIANPNERFIVARPGEPFILDGNGSRSGDLNGRGHLLCRWVIDGPIEVDYGWTQAWVQKSLAVEGKYLATLTVNDGDHQARAQVTVFVTPRKLSFDDFRNNSLGSKWRFMGQTWLRRDGLLAARRPGAGLNAAGAADQIYPSTLIVETLMRLDLLYPEASAPFGVGLAYLSPADESSVLLFGFVGTRRVDALRNPARKHMTEVAFYQAAPGRRKRLGDSILTFHDAAGSGYRLAQWYHVKLALEDGTKLIAKVWPLGTVEPDWMYRHVLERPKTGAPVPLLAAGIGTNGEADFDYFLVTSF